MESRAQDKHIAETATLIFVREPLKLIMSLLKLHLVWEEMYNLILCIEKMHNPILCIDKIYSGRLRQN